MRDRPSLKPDPPLANRLNRYALIVGALVVGLTVLTAVVLVPPTKEGQGPSSPDAALDQVSRVPSRPAFLDEPVRAAASADSGAGWRGANFARREPGALSGVSVVSAPADTGSEAVLRMTDSARRSRSAPRVGRGRGAARARAFEAALMSKSVLAANEEPGARAVAGVAAPSDSSATSLAREEERLLSLGDSVLRAASSGTGPTAGGVPTPAPTARPVPQPEGARPGLFAAAGGTRGGTVLARVDSSGSPYTLRAGTVIPALLLTAINSELRGDVVAQVSRDVFDSRTEHLVLIPKGARLIGTYDNQVAAGAGRLLVAWTRLILPDGRSIGLPGLPLKDPQGQSGARDQVDTHWKRVFGKALLLSAISAGVELSQPRQTSVLAAPSVSQVAAGALGQELSNVALEVLRRGMDSPPTFTIRQGQPFDVFLNGDLVFDGPYKEESP
jgi:type IV secretory pathway VirB10-like protein